MFISRLKRDRIRRTAAESALAGDQTPSLDPEMARELAAMYQLMQDLDDLPAQAWSDIPARPARHLRVSLTDIRLRMGAVAVAAALACLAGGVVIGENVGPGSMHRPPHARSGQTVALRPLSNSAVTASAVATMPAPGHMILNVRSLPASLPGTYYELWLMTNLHHLTPVASFRVGSSMRERLSLVLPDDPSRYAYLDISVQVIGSGTAHSNDSILRGAIE